MHNVLMHMYTRTHRHVYIYAQAHTPTGTYHVHRHKHIPTHTVFYKKVAKIVSSRALVLPVPFKLV